MSDIPNDPGDPGDPNLPGDPGDTGVGRPYPATPTSTGIGPIGESFDAHAASSDGPPAARRGSQAGPRRRRRRRVWRRRLVLLAVIVVLAVIGVGSWYWVEAHPSGKPGRAVLFDIREGTSTDAVVSALAAHGVIDSDLAFRLAMLIHGKPTVVPGQYDLHTNLSFSAVRTALAAGPNVTAVTVLPGQTLTEVARSLTVVSPTFAQTFLTKAKAGAVHSPYAASAGTTLEGLIGTGTYQVLPDEQATTLLTQMVDRFNTEAAKAGLTTTSAAAHGITEYQVVTVASISQKEGYFTRYLGPVAQVIYNRLAAGMNLAMTSTVLYSFGQDGGPVTAQEEATTTPYNTYLHPGLTPTPICVPSEAALAASVNPPAGTWLYFDLTTVQKGVMVFSTTFTGQLAAEALATANAAKSAGTHTTTPT